MDMTTCPSCGAIEVSSRGNVVRGGIKPSGTCMVTCQKVCKGRFFKEAGLRPPRGYQNPPNPQKYDWVRNSSKSGKKKST
eukprot:4454508-Amphidinium_carterae.1